VSVADDLVPENRWELYRLLSEPIRLRTLALAAEEELAVGELAELLEESQPNVSRHVGNLRRAGLLSVRRQGTRALVRLTDGVASDPVIADALAAGRGLCEREGRLARVAQLVRGRDADSRAFFAAPGGETVPSALPEELPAYLSALAPLLTARRLAVDVGTGDGSLLEVLAPIYERVVAVDRAEPQLARARERLARRGYSHVELLGADVDDDAVQAHVQGLGGADAVFASRVLHHAPKPASALARLSGLARPGGAVVVIDYQPHEDEGMRERQADLWLGFEPRELVGLAGRAGLTEPRVRTIPAVRCGSGPDGHLDWQVMVARRPGDNRPS
jgi:ArsR family transcriptional regulator